MVVTVVDAVDLVDVVVVVTVVDVEDLEDVVVVVTEEDSEVEVSNTLWKLSRIHLNDLLAFRRRKNHAPALSIICEHKSLTGG